MSEKEPRRKSVLKLKTTGKVKVKFSTTVDAELFERFRKVANEVFGLQRGALEYALEEAMQLWLYERAGARRSTNPPMNIRERYNAVLECIENEKGFVPISIRQPEFEKCIRDALKVKTERTVLEYLHTFYQLGFIKPLTIENPSSPSEWRKNKAVEIVAKKV